jgi:protoheme IX farnesyltransferase
MASKADMNASAAGIVPVALPADWRDFVALTKPGVMWLAVFTGLAALLAAPGHLNPILAFVAVLCIAMGAGAAGALNQWWEVDIDARMRRTAGRPLPAGRMERGAALSFGITLGIASVLLMGLALNWLAAGILAGSISFYLFIYTMWLKPRTPQNIVIGGAAGAFPPLIGWAAATGDVSTLPLLLFALIFLWTPPHFWALALFIKSDYANAGIPMLPVVAGRRTTRRQILIYSLPMAVVAVAPWAMGLTGALYGITASLLTLVFVGLAARVAVSREEDIALMRREKLLFGFSVAYLFILFAAVAIDRLVLA